MAEFKHIVRLHGTNIEGKKMLPYAICDVKGIGIRIARTIIAKLGLDPEERIGEVSDLDVRELEGALEEPSSIGVPEWMLNRRKDYRTGEDIHLITSELTMRENDDIELMKDTRSWKGVRHSLGLKVRGQRTKSTARRGKSVGVSRKRIREQALEKREKR
jgi:small subunit ribosomal protein S13